MQTSIDQVWGWDDAELRVFFDDRFTPERWQIIQVEGENVGVLVVEEDDEQEEAAPEEAAEEPADEPVAAAEPAAEKE